MTSRSEDQRGPQWCPPTWIALSLAARRVLIYEAAMAAGKHAPSSPAVRLARACATSTLCRVGLSWRASIARQTTRASMPARRFVSSQGPSSRANGTGAIAKVQCTRTRRARVEAHPLNGIWFFHLGCSARRVDDQEQACLSVSVCLDIYLILSISLDIER